MRLPQQLQSGSTGSARTGPQFSIREKPDGAVRQEPSIRPSWSTGGTADCYARCSRLPPGPERSACMLDCY